MTVSGLPLSQGLAHDHTAHRGNHYQLLVRVGRSGSSEVALIFLSARRKSGFGTLSNETGCRGFIGPVPQPHRDKCGHVRGDCRNCSRASRRGAIRPVRRRVNPFSPRCATSRPSASQPFRSSESLSNGHRESARPKRGTRRSPRRSRRNVAATGNRGRGCRTGTCKVHLPAKAAPACNPRRTAVISR